MIGNIKTTFAVLTFLLVTGASTTYAAKTNEEAKTRPPEQADSIAVKLEFTYNNFLLPVRVFELNDQKGTTGRWRVVKNKKALPFGSELTGKPIRIRKGVTRSVVISVENTTDKDLYFYASPHDTVPSENSLGNKFFCFCYGHVYKVPAKATWYRIAQLNIEKNSFGNEIAFKHRVIGISPEKVKQYLENMKQSGGG